MKMKQMFFYIGKIQYHALNNFIGSPIKKCIAMQILKINSSRFPKS